MNIVFGPVLFRPAVFDNSYILNVPKQSKAVELLIEEYSEIFSGEMDVPASPAENIKLQKKVSWGRIELDAIEEEEEEEEDDDEEENKEEINKIQESKMPAFMKQEHIDSTLPHNWVKGKTMQISWCAGCQKIIAPTSRKKPVKIKSCKTCEIPIHPGCVSSVSAGCVDKSNIAEEKSLFGQEAPNIPNVTKDENGNPVSLHDILESGKKVVLFFYPMCKLYFLTYI